MANNGYPSGIEFFDSLGTSQVAYFGSRLSSNIGFYGFTGAGWNLINLNPATGQVAISTTRFATGYSLTIAGKMICEEARVQPQANWPDYVFADDYKLKPIEEVEQEILKHKHLPGIPSQKEISENGIALGEMQTKQMEKIEELTLYIIQLEKRIKELESTVSYK